MAQPAPTYPPSTFAKLFDLSERRIQQLAKEGVIPKAVNGQYELVSVVRGYVKYLQARAAGRQDAQYTDPTDIRLERKRLIKAQADHAECDYQVKRDQLVRLDVVIDALNETAILYGSSLDALPGRLAQELTGMHDPAVIKNRLFDECRHIRNLTAERLCRLAKDRERDGRVSEASASPSRENP